MSKINRVEYSYKKPGLRKDDSTGKWVGHQVDVRNLSGKRIRQLFSSRKAAEDFVARVQTQRIEKKSGLKATKQILPVALKKLTDAQLAEITHVKEHVRSERVFQQFSDSFETLPTVGEISTADIQNWINIRLATGVKAKTVDREVTIISTALHSAAQKFPHELEGYDPPRIPRPPLKKRKINRHVITEEELRRIVTAIRNDRLQHEHSVRTKSRESVAGMFEVAWYLGLRFSEVKKLDKTDHRQKEETLRVIRWKTNDFTLFPFLPKRVAEILSEAAKRSTSDRIFETFTSENTISDILEKACATAGVLYGRGKLDAITFHSTRHSFTTRMSQVADIGTTQSFTSHSNAEMIPYYSHATDESKRLAMERMYGNKATADLGAIYDRIVAGKLTKTAFIDLLK